jgi:hypothetical protein
MDGSLQFLHPCPSSCNKQLWRSSQNKNTNLRAGRKGRRKKDPNMEGQHWALQEPAGVRECLRGR